MAHKNEEAIPEVYAAFAKGDLETVLGLCDDGIVFHVPGRTSFSGVHTKADFGAWIGEVMRICDGTFQEEIVDVLVSDDRVLVVLDHHFQKNGKPEQYFASHLWTVKDGRFSEFRELPDDQDEFTAA